MPIKKVFKHSDYILIGIIGFLTAFGIVILASVSAPYSQEKFGSTYYLIKHQILFALIPGLILGFLAYRINLALLKKWAPILLLINLFLLTMVFIPVIGSKSGGALRWIYFGFLSFQPAELLKLTFIIYLASWLSSRFSKSNIIKKEFSQNLFVFLIIIGVVSLLLISQPNVSTLGVIFLVAILMYFSINTPLWHNLLMVLIGIGGLFVLMKVAPYRSNRLSVFLNPGGEPMGMGYQLKQALISVGSGGLGGAGLGMSMQKFGFLPESISDSIFAVFAEETGFVGGVLLILLFLFFLWKGLEIAKKSGDTFSQLAVIGIVSWITIQAFVNIGAMTGILPLTGIPLPFISYGGSALISELIGAGILINISKNAV